MLRDVFPKVIHVRPLNKHRMGVALNGESQGYSTRWDWGRWEGVIILAQGVGLVASFMWHLKRVKLQLAQHITRELCLALLMKNTSWIIHSKSTSCCHNWRGQVAFYLENSWYSTETFRNFRHSQNSLNSVINMNLRLVGMKTIWTYKWKYSK